MLDFWLCELRRRGWCLHTFGDRRSPALLAATWRWRNCVDVVLIRSEGEAVAYRTADPDPFAPLVISWVYGSSAIWALRAALTLDPPGQAPVHPMTAPPACQVPEALRGSVTINPL